FRGSTLVGRGIRQHDLHLCARRQMPLGRAEQRKANAFPNCRGGLHVWSVALAQWEIHAELRIELRKLVQADEFILAPAARADVARNAVLMVRSAARLDDAPPLLAPDDARPSCAGSLLAFADAGLLLRCAVGRGDGHLAMHIDKRSEEFGSRDGEWPGELVD